MKSLPLAALACLLVLPDARPVVAPLPAAYHSAPPPAARLPVALEEMEGADLVFMEDGELFPPFLRWRIAERNGWGGWGEGEPVVEGAAGRVTRWTIPRAGRGPLHLLVSREEPDAGISRLALWLFDPGTGALSKEPTVLSNRFLGEEGLHPRLADLDRDGAQELVVHQVSHNGTVENTDFAVFLELTEEMGLREVLRVPLRALDFYSMNESGCHRGRLLHTDLDGRPALAFEDWTYNPRYGIPPQITSTVYYERPDPAGPWTLVEAARVR
ncbi:MAG: hypothetical protein H6828_03035 [Planctomycetes bacterium]|nr:hypothetical protein [Planctomycetota bacterium]